MSILDEKQRQRAVEVMEEYLHAPAGIGGYAGGKTPVEDDAELDAKRVEVIQTLLHPLLSSFLDGQISVQDFKSKVDSINKKNELWGFKGIKGQMFFNMVVNVAADDLEECKQEMISALAAPDNDTLASSRIKTFASYVKRLGEAWVSAGNTKYGAPKIGSIPFFLSYFWQVQNRQLWPTYYTTSVQALTDLNLWQPTDDIASDYVAFKKLHEELAELFSDKSGSLFDLYRVEHVLWYKGNLNKAVIAKPAIPVPAAQDDARPSPPPNLETLPDSYLPPIISVLPAMSRNEPAMIEAAGRSGISLDRAFEKYINAAFSILGYETKLLGQGSGRVPDGLAYADDYNYAIIWDGKIRADGYKIGTDDRTIKDYITTQSREMKRKRTYRNIYYFVISSCFADDYDDLVRSIKMDTDVNEVIFLEIEALVAMVEAKLRDPLQITIGPDALQRLFSCSGILTSRNVQDML
ncbi:restriction endonuclease FokI C-terminal domain-containing protein [Geomonas edaphica]|uniref:restriction endonuclease FokI C-terminal domain-containing protein n=1 Tax=Geomonas edaphica TaxID=2570226 RepID=UPI0010A922A1|nr:hypothetical protein [Geomonas edaphica]